MGPICGVPILRAMIRTKKSAPCDAYCGGKTCRRLNRHKVQLSVEHNGDWKAPWVVGA
jgi:hypothetical protein